MKKTIFRGIGTALITPMTSTGVDYDNLARLIDFQIENGVAALVAVGTTGESATLTTAERKEVIRFTVERTAGRVPVIAGTGTNNTEHPLLQQGHPERPYQALRAHRRLLRQARHHV